MNYPRLFRRVYAEPLCISRASWASIHAVLLPRIAGTVAEGAPPPIAGINRRPALAPSRMSAQACRASSVGAPMDEENAEPNAAWTLAAPGVACVPLYGVLGKNISLMEAMCGGVDVGTVSAAITACNADPRVLAIVLDIASPGGSVTGIPELAQQVAQSVKPVYAFTDDECCSAAYWVASQTRGGIYATPSSMIGSIGVYLALLDQCVAMELQGLKLELFVAGAHKGLGLPGRPLSDEDRALLQGGVDKIYAWFSSQVQATRPGVASASMQGQVFDGQDAAAAGLVDFVVTGWHEMIDAVAEISRGGL